MRISDWSSDVCSSDLVQTETRHADRRAERDLGQRQRQSRDAHQYRRDGDTEQQGKNLNRSAHRQIERGDAEMCSPDDGRSEEHTSELQSLMRISYAVFCLKKKL